MTERKSQWTRAGFLRRSAAAGTGLVLAGGAGYGIDRLLSDNGTSSAAATGRRAQHFLSRPDLKPPTVTVLHPAEATAPGSLFVAPSSGPGQRGVLIMDDLGQVIWFRSTDPLTAMDFRPGLYRGKPVLTWWESLPGGGLGNGEHVMVDATYREIARFPAGNHRPSDLHELRLTSAGTALVTSFETRPMDLSRLGGSKHGRVMGGVAQELEIPSARVVLEWRSLDHVGVGEAYNAVGNPWDYFHINSIDVDADGDLLISGRNTWTVYKVHRRTGRVIWRLGGKKSDFKLGKGVRFAYQHDARHHAGGSVISVFDNGGAERTQVESQSRGLMISLDVARRRATLIREYVHRPSLFGRQMGNVQALPDGNVLVGWGTDPHLTEYAEDGTVRFDATLPHGGENYRAFRFPWTGRPTERPALVQAGSALYASWNGATDLAAWRLDAGPAPARLAPVGTHPRRGFETVLDVPPGAAYAAAVALDRDGRPLRTSAVARLS